MATLFTFLGARNNQHRNRRQLSTIEAETSSAFFLGSISSFCRCHLVWSPRWTLLLLLHRSAAAAASNQSNRRRRRSDRAIKIAAAKVTSDDDEMGGLVRERQRFPVSSSSCNEGWQTSHMCLWHRQHIEYALLLRVALLLMKACMVKKSFQSVSPKVKDSLLWQPWFTAAADRPMWRHAAVVVFLSLGWRRRVISESDFGVSSSGMERRERDLEPDTPKSRAERGNWAGVWQSEIQATEVSQICPTNRHTKRTEGCICTARFSVEETSLENRQCKAKLTFMPFFWMAFCGSWIWTHNAWRMALDTSSLGMKETKEKIEVAN